MKACRRDGRVSSARLVNDSTGYNPYTPTIALSQKETDRRLYARGAKSSEAIKFNKIILKNIYKNIWKIFLYIKLF